MDGYDTIITFVDCFTKQAHFIPCSSPIDAEQLAKELPTVGGVVIQMADEIASITATLGAAMGGVKAMTATSGPDFRNGINLLMGQHVERRDHDQCDESGKEDTKCQ